MSGIAPHPSARPPSFSETPLPHDSAISRFSRKKNIRQPPVFRGHAIARPPAAICSVVIPSRFPTLTAVASQVTVARLTGHSRAATTLSLSAIDRHRHQIEGMARSPPSPLPPCHAIAPLIPPSKIVVEWAALSPAATNAIATHLSKP